MNQTQVSKLIIFIKLIQVSFFFHKKSFEISKNKNKNLNGDTACSYK